MRIRKKFICSKCKTETFKFSGYCPSCKAAGTMKEQTTQATASRETPERRRIRRRAKTSERDIARRMTAVDGFDPAFKHIASSTGRIGMITGIRVDAVSQNYVTEAKNRVLPKWVGDAWLLINQRAIDFGKNALLHLDPPNIKRDFVLNGTKYRLDTMAVITQTRHESLIISERKLNLIKDVIESEDSNVIRVRKIKDILEG